MGKCAHNSITTLEADRDCLDERTATLEARVDDLEDETAHLKRLADAALKKATTNKEQVTELQSRELEKGAHLREETVDEHLVEVPDGRLEPVTKDDGKTYFRLPEGADPLD